MQTFINFFIFYTMPPHYPTGKKPRHANRRKEAYLFCDIGGPLSMFSFESSKLLLCTQGSFFWCSALILVHKGQHKYISIRIANPQCCCKRRGKVLKYRCLDILLFSIRTGRKCCTYNTRHKSSQQTPKQNTVRDLLHFDFNL